MKAKKIKAFMAAALAVCMVASMTGCGKSKVALNDGEFQEVDKAELEFPLKEKTEISGMTSYPANTPETDKVHTWDISTYSVPISSSYTAESGNPNYYTLTLTAQVEAQLQADGSMHYTLKLPDVEQMTAADGSTVTHTDFTITNMAVFIANVQKNLEATPSSAYAASDPCEIKWNN